MLHGTLCPRCNKPVMPYLRFLREAEPYKLSKCSHCQVELKRKPIVWLLLLLGGTALAAVAALALPYVGSRWGVVGSASLVVLAVVTFTLVLNVCGWLFIGWNVASQPSDSSRTPPSLTQ